ncbi:unnamed protein product [Gulo gulo]|uniref:Uncharacterized protein n=1 Tax=Gulo gulo TaxID=48420 RepID=A0A9X9Q324_GULGU|nr:unnamed protein product [Gulo gulo]
MCALCVSSHDCSHIHKAGGKIFIFDQLAWTLPRAVAPSYSLVHESAHRYRIGVYWQGPRDPTQPHQTLCAIQELEAGAGQMQQGQHQLQKVTPDLALLLKRVWC